MNGVTIYVHIFDTWYIHFHLQLSKINIHRTCTISVVKTYEIYPIMYFEEKKKKWWGLSCKKKNSKKKHVFPKKKNSKRPLHSSKKTPSWCQPPNKKKTLGPLVMLTNNENRWFLRKFKMFPNPMQNVSWQHFWVLDVLTTP